MYFRPSLRNSPATKQSEGYWRLVESYRNEFGRVCHRTIYNVGFITFKSDKLVTIQRILNSRLERKLPLFEETDQEAISIADKYWHEMVSKKKIDVSDQVFEKSKRLVDIDTLKNKDAREIGAEWICFQGIEQLQFKEKNHYESEKPAIVFSEMVSVKSEPQNDSNSIFTLHEGTKVFILETLNNWKKIQLTDGTEGWIEKTAIREVK